MIKYSLILIGIYFLYYAGNIVYDLFLKKEKVLITDEAEEYSMGDFAPSPPPTTIGIEDVENISTPSSFLKNGFEPKTPAVEKQTEHQPELDELRKRFEAEQDLDETEPASSEPESSEHDADVPINHFSAEQPVQPVEAPQVKEAVITKKAADIKSFWRQAETMVQMVDNIEGQKVYNIMQYNF